MAVKHRGRRADHELCCGVRGVELVKAKDFSEVVMCALIAPRQRTAVPTAILGQESVQAHDAMPLPPLRRWSPKLRKQSFQDLLSQLQ